MIPLRSYTVYVDVASHDDLKAGLVCTGVARIEVIADGWHEARLIACQMAAIHGIPTAAVVDDVTSKRNPDAGPRPAEEPRRCRCQVASPSHDRLCEWCGRLRIVSVPKPAVKPKVRPVRLGPVKPPAISLANIEYRLSRHGLGRQPSQKLSLRQRQYLELLFEAGDPDACYYCGTALDDTNRTIDHWIPRSKGGGEGLENLRLSCTECNTMKADLDPRGTSVERVRAIVRKRRCAW